MSPLSTPLREIAAQRLCSTRRFIQRRATSFFEFGLPFPPWMAYTLWKNMESFAFGFPPDGQSVDPYRSDSRIPDSIREEVIRRYEAEYPTGYVVAFWDPDTQIFGFYTRTKENWKKLDDIDEIVLFPIKPAKGSGFIIVGCEDTNAGWPDDFFLGSSRYTESLHDWIRSRSERLAAMIGKPFREAPAGADC